jgi:hypothetical protein
VALDSSAGWGYNYFPSLSDHPARVAVPRKCKGSAPRFWLYPVYDGDWGDRGLQSL